AFVEAQAFGGLDLALAARGVACLLLGLRLPFGVHRCERQEIVPVIAGGGQPEVEEATATLLERGEQPRGRRGGGIRDLPLLVLDGLHVIAAAGRAEIGRASCRERGQVSVAAR